jgi:hypothetical protein
MKRRPPLERPPPRETVEDTRDLFVDLEDIDDGVELAGILRRPRKPGLSYTGQVKPAPYVRL